MEFEENVETVLRAMRGESIDVGDNGSLVLIKDGDEEERILSDEERPTIHMFSATMPPGSLFETTRLDLNHLLVVPL